MTRNEIYTLLSNGVNGKSYDEIRFTTKDVIRNLLFDTFSPGETLRLISITPFETDKNHYAMNFEVEGQPHRTLSFLEIDKLGIKE